MKSLLTLTLLSVVFIELVGYTKMYNEKDQSETGEENDKEINSR